jgi:glutamine cyclotransferase
MSLPTPSPGASATTTAGAQPTPSNTSSTTPVWTYRIVNRYPHDPAAFTQGLVVDDGWLIEGTGLVGESSLRRVELDTGTVVARRDLPEPYFGEGVTILGDQVYQLTWQSEVAFVYDRQTFEPLMELPFSGEGWGITTDGTSLIMSDGSGTLTFRDPETFTAIRRVTVRDSAGEVDQLNELEYIDGEVWANIWKDDRIARIDPETGTVRAWIDLTGLHSDELRKEPDADVLNGIAHDPVTDRVFVTGKRWPWLFEIEVVEDE